MKMAKKWIKTGLFQQFLNTNIPLLWYYSHLGSSRQNRDTMSARSRSSFKGITLRFWIQIKHRMIKYLNRALKVKRFCRFLQYQRRGIGKLVLKDQHQLVLKYQQATPLELAGMPLRLGLMEDCFTVISYNS